MYSDDDLDAAVGEGILTRDAATAFRAFVARRQSAHEADEESVSRFRSQPRISFYLRITGVHDHLED